MSLFHLLSIGTDSSVLATRSDVMKRAGYLVSTASNETSARTILEQSDFDLVVICHSLPPADRKKVIGAARAATKSPKIVAIHRGEKEAAADGAIHSLDGPDMLLQCIAEVLGEGTGRISKLP